MRRQPRSDRRVLSIDAGPSGVLRREPPSVGVRGAREARGASGAARAALLAGLTVLALAVFLLVRRGEGEAAVEPVTSAEAGPAPTQAPPESGSTESGSTRAPRATRGSLRGAVSVRPPATMPESWTLSVRPTSFGDPGGAVERVVELSGDEREFALEDLPFGRYDVRARAEGLNSYAVPVELSAETPFVYVTSLLTPAGTLTGRLLHEDGTGIEGVRVRLRDQRSGDEHAAATDASGAFAFPGIPDGEYELSYGDPENPLLEPRAISFRAPSMHLSADYVEGVGRVELEVIDLSGNPVEGAALAGSGSRGGTIDRLTGADGRCRVVGLPTGQYRVRATHPELGEDVQTFVLESGSNPPLRFVLE